MATQFTYLLVDEDGDLFGTNSAEIAEAAEEAGFTSFRAEDVPELDSDEVMPDEGD